MSMLRIRFGAATNHPARVPVEIISSNSVRVWKGILRMEQSVSAELPPGRYLVSARLPNGSVLQAQKTLDADSAIVDVSLEPETKSPSESLGWAYYLQRSFFTESQNAIERNRLTSFEASVHSGRLDSVVPTVWRCDGENWMPISWHLWPQSPIDASHQDPILIDCGQISAPLWLQCQSDSHSIFIALPGNHGFGLQTAIKLTEDNSLAVAVGGFQPDAEALLNYLTTGDFSSARVIGPEVERRAEQLLQQKMDDPIAATIAGYYLLKIGDLARLHDWSFNLANWFPLIPDGAIIAGWHAIRLGEHRRGARHFSMALQRGIPLFTLGLQQLLDGLLVTREHLPAEGIDGETQAQRLRQYVTASKANSGVTCFNAVDPRYPHFKS